MALSFGASTDAHAFGDLHRLRSEYSIAELCRRDGTAESFYCGWSKEFLEAGKRRVAGTPPERPRRCNPGRSFRAPRRRGRWRELRHEAQELKEVVGPVLELHADGGDGE